MIGSSELATLLQAVAEYLGDLDVIRAQSQGSYATAQLEDPIAATLYVLDLQNSAVDDHQVIRLAESFSRARRRCAWRPWQAVLAAAEVPQRLRSVLRLIQPSLPVRVLKVQLTDTAASVSSVEIPIQ